MARRLRNGGERASFVLRIWSRGWESNPQPPVYKTDALPLSYLGAPTDDTREVDSGAGCAVLHRLRLVKRLEGLLDGQQHGRLE